MASKMFKLFSPLTLGGKKNPVQLQHRVVMAPLTRLRTGEEGVPTDLVAEYYTQRSTRGGLLIAEATNISPTARGYFGAPGLFTSEQVAGWKKVTQAVHDKGGKIFVQLWHSGRVGHTLNQPNGEQPVSSSALPFKDAASVAVTQEGRRPYSIPRPLETHEIPGIAADYKRAAECAIEAGFNGVELHGANGYLLEQFLCDSVNDRTDEYGGSIENRARLTLQALQGVLSSLDSSQVAIRVSPFGNTFGCTDSAPEETYSYLIKQLSPLDLAYLHIVEPRGLHPTAQNVPEGGTTTFSRKLYDGVLMTSSGFGRTEGIDVTESGLADCVAYGRSFIANPDLVHRLEVDAPWNVCDYKTFYPLPDVPMSAGYTDYPALELKAEVAKA
ncbi:12-oxophytodienoate reductase 1 [Phytophthora ramorum]|uniref:12-oxophytodienoate reductase 1 n=1 Tax=Phytophthora ramorum TaxID=164328 RepID=UPI00309A6508|nr:12-oxophytodienoate reductase 1 [Phytophthora ramorum]